MHVPLTYAEGMQAPFAACQEGKLMRLRGRAGEVFAGEAAQSRAAERQMGVLGRKRCSLHTLPAGRLITGLKEPLAPQPLSQQGPLTVLLAIRRSSRSYLLPSANRPSARSATRISDTCAGRSPPHHRSTSVHGRQAISTVLGQSRWSTVAALSMCHCAAREPS